ncbi:dihydropteroate synthase [Aporhodopirellula aestuarii]|uniref:Dihydropteroate synthase n=1 Tax=Aporhodopirellula aestuarii TaxID=2950107 RepID=A0ABT0TXU1_9BACT|nr:dihydropteroate synthase [Aporhodopirellula aestuarii]MCM2369355.1 dihydropteroate synthase [Aporhodopirellula aestuarii]
MTGRLAEVALRTNAAQAATSHGVAHSVQVAPITVAALITPKWLTRHLDVPSEATDVILPGYCDSALDDAVDPESPRTTWRMRLAEIAGLAPEKIVCGPNDCRDLDAWLGGKIREVDLTDHSIEIIAEINHAPRLSIDEVVRIAENLRADGADRIDFGCDPSRRCDRVGDYVKALIAAGHRVSIDTFDPHETRAAVDVGASLVLSVNSSNRESAADWGCEVVAIPDTPDDLDSLESTIEFLSRHNVPMRLDPILEPIGFGFGASLLRYVETRRRYPELAMMMGIGNLTELTDVDSAGVNMLLLALCEEFGVGSVLTTQVINWARSSIKECDIARRMVHYSLKEGVPPKRVSDQLISLRDPKLRPYSPEALESLASGIRDNNYRIIAQDGVVHLISAGVHLCGDEPFAMMSELLSMPQSSNVDVSHAFYLGFELAKAKIAAQLGKQYEQDQALQWGHLTVEEERHRIPRQSRHRKD